MLWTAELRPPRPSGTGERPPSPLILFWSDTRACLATIRGQEALSDLTDDELRHHLRICLSG